MANTYTQIYLHLIFSVKYRTNLIRSEWEQNLYNYIVSILQDRSHTAIALNGTEDHIHILIGFTPNDKIPDLVKTIKQNSSIWVKKHNYCNDKFGWQEGYGCFSYSKSQIDTVVKYIRQQKEHHREKTFREEYLEFLNKFGVEYNEKYVTDI